jgi:transcriptional regulator of met regulon
MTRKRDDDDKIIFVNVPLSVVKKLKHEDEEERKLFVLTHMLCHTMICVHILYIFTIANTSRENLFEGSSVFVREK